jgi:hypothetical protein
LQAAEKADLLELVRDIGDTSFEVSYFAMCDVMRHLRFEMTGFETSWLYLMRKDQSNGSGLREQRSLVLVGENALGLCLEVSR